VCENGATLFRYSWQLDWGQKAGYRRDQIVMGMPTWVDTWGSGGIGPNVVDHLREVRALGGGVGLWDMQLAAAGWSKPATWEAVQALRRPASALARRPSFLERLFHRGAAGGGAGGDTVTATDRNAAAPRFRAAPSPTR
jgi:hypothetical protein